MRALWLPLFGELSDPGLVADLAVLAEQHGWDGLFVWDHIRWREPVTDVGDPWVTLAAVASRTERLRIGTAVTPPARRRPAVLARQAVALDLLSNGRMILGIGVGSDRFGDEYSRLGDETDDRTRAAMTDETLEILRAAWTGEPVTHHGEHHTVDRVAFRPRPVQRPGIPVWIAGFPGRARPRRRAARHDGFFPVNMTDSEELTEALADIATHRAGTTAPFDVAVAVAPDADPEPWVRAGATWLLTEHDPATVHAAEVRRVIRRGWSG
jgi:alkanesulfonate monooxygenase SsuD/methylene tetrahydromethanopterin reductase-like flavin-dependent oxidoreductase (luciferase family)